LALHENTASSFGSSNADFELDKMNEQEIRCGYPAAEEAEKNFDLEVL
jgi:hypothetical protein